jgi:hypothetical protein
MARGTWGEGGDGTSPLRVTLKVTNAATTMQVGFFLRALPPSLATLEDCANHVNTNVVDTFKECFLTTDQIRSVDVLDITTKEGFSVELDAVTGTIGTGNAPDFTMVPISFKTGFRQRIGQGRMLFPVRGPGEIDGNVLSALGKARIGAFVTDLRNNYLAPIAGHPWQMITAHEALLASRPHKRPEPLPAVPAEWYDVTSIRLNDRLSSLRSRKLGQGS